MSDQSSNTLLALTDDSGEQAGSDRLEGLDALDRERRRVLLSVSLVAIIMAGGWSGFGYLLVAHGNAEIGHVLGVSVLVFLLYLFAKFQITRNFVQDYKRRIIQPLVQRFDGNLGYTTDHSLSEAVFTQSGLFQGWNRFNGDDLISGNHHGVSMAISELHAWYSTKHTSSQIFNGLFAVIDIRPVTPLDLSIVSYNYNFNRGGIDANLLVRGLGETDTWFHDEFKTFAPDPILALSLLDEKLRDDLLRFKNKLNTNLHFAFREARLYIAIDYGNRDLLEPSLTRRVHDDLNIAFTGQLLSAFSRLIDDLRSNPLLFSGSGISPSDMDRTETPMLEHLQSRLQLNGEA